MADADVVSCGYLEQSADESADDVITCSADECHKDPSDDAELNDILDGT